MTAKASTINRGHYIAGPSIDSSLVFGSSAKFNMTRRLKSRVQNLLLLLMALALATSLLFAFIESNSTHNSTDTSFKVRLEAFSQFNHTRGYYPRIPPQAPSEPFPIVILPFNGSVDPFYNIPSDGTNLWDNDRRLPPWMKAYFDWHKHKRQLFDPTKWADERWMVMQCLASHDARRCGGTADRLVSVCRCVGEPATLKMKFAQLVACRSPSLRF
jgi:hypothetical protein